MDYDHDDNGSDDDDDHISYCLIQQRITLSIQ
jgi:thiamine phosphate synthase YjbQ (UPF0047 family)